LKIASRVGASIIIVCVLLTTGEFSFSEDASALAPLSASARREVYVVDLGRSSGGRLFLAPTEPREGVAAGDVVALRGALLSRTSAGNRRMLFSVSAADGTEVYSVDLTVAVEPGSLPFGFEWVSTEAPEGDYLARLLILDAALGEDARAEWRVSVRDAAAVAGRVEAARAEVARAQGAAAESMPARARETLALALESLASFPSTERPLIEADENAAFALHAAAHVRGGLALGKFSGVEAAPAPNAESLFASDAPFRGTVALGSTADTGQRLARLGFDFVPWTVSAQSVPPPLELPVFVWLEASGGETPSRTPEELKPFEAKSGIIAVSLWTSPGAQPREAQTLRDFRDFVRGEYGDRTKMNRAWKQHLFGFDEVEFWPGIENRAYQYDVLNFERRRTSQWLSEGIHRAEPVLAPAAPTMTFSDGILVPGETRFGLDAEALAPMLSVVPIRITGPLDDGRFALRYPAANIVYALFRSFAPGKPLVVVHSIDYDLSDRLRMDSASQLRTLAVEAAVEGVSGMVIEMPSLDDIARQAPEAVAGFAGALQDLRGAREAIASMQGEPAPVAILWSDSSKVVDGGDAHLRALINAYEGCNFGGQHAGFITERQLADGQWHGVRVLVLPEVSALTEEAFAGIESLIASGAAVIRTESGPVYDEHGRALGRTLNAGRDSILVRGKGEPREYLDAVDELISRGTLPETLRATTRNGFPIEGVKTRYTKGAAGEILYLVNLRKEPVDCRLNREIGAATDLLTGRIVEFPRRLEPLNSLLLRIDAAASDHPATPTPSADSENTPEQG